MADLGGDGGDAFPPTSLKVTILAEKSASISNNSAPFRDASPPHQPKRNESGRKLTLNFGEDLFFFYFLFFGDHLILGEKNVWISDFGRKITLNFGESIRIFEVLSLKSPPPKFSRSATGLGAKPPAVGQFFGKKSYFNAIVSHFAYVWSHLKALDFWHLKVN